jgi:nicotinamidase/pyrazinamidase
VLATALDAVRAGYETTVLLDLTAGVLPGTTESAVRDMQAAGVQLVGAPHAGR